MGYNLAVKIEKVKESIWIILRTGVGERVYRPTFGSRLSELAFAPLNSDTLLRIRLYVLEALEVWEPRITIDGLEFTRFLTLCVAEWTSLQLST